MDGLKYVVPMSCSFREFKFPVQTTLFDGKKHLDVKVFECDGCGSDDRNRHNGIYAKIMDWEANEPIRFVDIANRY
jgi:hypothetical protein